MDLIAVGRIAKPIGTRGEVKILPLTNVWQRFDNLAAVRIGRDSAHVEEKMVLSRRIDAKQVILQLSGIESIEDAERIKDFYLFIQKKDMVTLQKGTYFVDEVIGCEVITEGHVSVGVVTDLFSLPANDVWIVKKDSKEILIPAVKEIIRQVDLEHKRITIHAIEGLVD
jgi:16S rRNA processing protein RimM